MGKVLKAGSILMDTNKKKIALVYRENLNDYSFPKEQLEKNESLVECAIRETEEETKRICIVLDNEPFLLSYITPRGEDVIVYFYLCKDGGKSDNDSTDTHPVVWVDYDKVYDKLSYDNLKELWLRAKDSVSDYFK